MLRGVVLCGLENHHLPAVIAETELRIEIVRSNNDLPVDPTLIRPFFDNLPRAATIRTEAKSLRAKQLTELTDRADQANANLSLPTMGMVIGMVLFLAYPIMQQISDAFT